MDGELEPTRSRHWRRDLLIALDVIMALAAASAVSALSLEFGFYELPRGIERHHLHAVEGVVLALFVIDRFARLFVSASWRAYLKENWFDFVLMGAAGIVAAVVMAGRKQVEILPAVTTYVVITQVYILVVLVLRMAGFQMRVAGSGIHPMWVLIGGFALAILAGAGVLMLPKASPQSQPVGFTDALFTATSAACVTGLTVRDTGAGFTPFGQAVILILIQLGGLGIMIFGTLFAMMIGRGLSLRDTLLAGQAISDEMVGRIGRMSKFVVVSTLLIELAGAALSYPMWAQVPRTAGLETRLPNASEAVWDSLFHGVSAFCNAGFSTRSDNLAAVRHHWQVIGVLAPLIVLGGLGFPVLYDLARQARHALARVLGRARGGGPALSLHSRLVLIVTAVLIVGGSAGLLAIEAASYPGRTFGARIEFGYNPRGGACFGSALAELPWPEQIREGVFQSVTARTAGFNTIDEDRLSEGGKFWTVMLMMVGGSPASTAGGFKTVTLAVLVLAAWSMCRQRGRVEGLRRTIAEPFVHKALTLFLLYLGFVALSTLLLNMSMRGTRLASTGLPPTFMQLFFESASACGTVGLSCNVTPYLKPLAKYVIIFSMFIGRLGPLTLLLALTLHIRPARYAYPSEEVVLG